MPYEDGFRTFFKDIDISNIDKTEIGLNGVLVVPATFDVKTLWYEPKEIVYTIDSITNELRWDFVWDPVFSSYDNRNIVFENEGHTEAPIRLELDGEITDLIISILENDEVVKQLNLETLTIESGEKFVYDTRDTNQAIYKIDTNNEIVNLFEFLSPNFINFYKLSKGVSTIRLEADGEITSGKIIIYVQYIAV